MDTRAILCCVGVLLMSAAFAADLPNPYEKSDEARVGPGPVPVMEQMFWVEVKLDPATDVEVIAPEGVALLDKTKPGHALRPSAEDEVEAGGGGWTRFYFRSDRGVRDNGIVLKPARGKPISVPLTVRTYREDLEEQIKVVPGVDPSARKQGRSYYTDEMMGIARENLAKEPALGDRIKGTTRYDEMSDEETFAALPSWSVPRQCYSNWPCPHCGEVIYRHSGFYPWRVDTNEPFKLKCPDCGEYFPTNDWLNDDFTSGDYPDDGWGLDLTGKGERGDFAGWVAYYNHHTLWQRLGGELKRLSLRHLLFGDEEAAHKCGVLLARMAYVYPGLNMRWQQVYAYGYLDSKSNMAEILSRVTSERWKSRCNLYDERLYPKFRAEFDTWPRMLVAGQFGPNYGDSGGPRGSRYPEGIVKNLRLEYERAYRRRPTDEIAREIYRAGQRDPNLFEPDVWEQIEEHATRVGPAPPLESRVLDGVGFVFLESRAQAQEMNRRAGIALRYGYGRGHHHHDNLNVELWAHGLDLAPELGYPCWAHPMGNTNFVAHHITGMIDYKPQYKSAISHGSLEMFAGAPEASFADVSAEPDGFPNRFYRRAVCLAELEPEARLRCGELEFQGSFGYWSELDGKPRCAHLVNGTRLVKGEVGVTQDEPRIEATVTKVDLTENLLTLDRKLPVGDELAGALIYLRGGEHRTAYHIAEVLEPGDVVRLDLNGIIFRSKVEAFAEDGSQLVCELPPSIEAARNFKPGYYNGALLTGEDLKARYRVERVEGEKVFADRPLDPVDFPDADGDGRVVMSIHDHGPGDQATICSSVFRRWE